MQATETGLRERALGITRDTALEGQVDDNLKGEGAEVPHYLACARQAEREGYPEAAVVLERIAHEEACHGARFAELNGRVDGSTAENIRRLIKEEKASCLSKKEWAAKATAAGIDAAHDVFDESSRDEARHVAALEGLLQRYFS